MINSEITEIFNKLYGEIDGYKISTQARLNSDQDVQNLLYGELTLETCHHILEKANPKRGRFFDLGSGTGRVVFALQLLGNFEKSTGIELLTGLYNKSTELHKVFRENSFAKAAEKIEFINGNIFDIDLSEADFILLNHPFKDGDIFLKLEDKLLKELKIGTKIVTTIRSLKNQKFKSLGNATYEFSWGKSTAYFFEIV